MRIFRSLRAKGLSVLLPILAACAGPGPDAQEPASPDPGIAGVLADEAGEPLAWVNVMACTTTVCYYADSDADGRFLFPIDNGFSGVLKTAPTPVAGERLTSPMVPLHLDAGEFVDIGRIHAPGIGPGHRVEPSTSGLVRVDAGDGLTLALDPGELEALPGQSITEVAARRIPDSLVPVYPDIDPDTIVAVYAIHPFATKSAVPVGIDIASDLPAGTPVTFRTIDSIDGTLSDPVAGTATGEALVSESEVGITNLTHLIVQRAN